MALLCGSLSYQIHQYQLVSEEYRQAKKTKIDLEYELDAGLKTKPEIRKYESVKTNHQKKYDRLRPFSGKIIYASRTHSQLSQVVKEVQKLPEELISGYFLNSDSLKVVVLGGKKSCKLFVFF